MKKLEGLCLVVLLAASIAVPGGARPGAGAAQPAQPVMRAHHIAVGQGDATLLEFPCGAVLVDAGAQDAEHVTRLVDYLARFFAGRPDLQRTLASIIITH